MVCAAFFYPIARIRRPPVGILTYPQIWAILDWNMSNNRILSTIRTPDDLKKLTFPELRKLSLEIRAAIVDAVSKNGGHLSSNLGAVELTIALHRVFSTPEDGIVWDVGHQCYAHKMLTGRCGRFDALRRKNGISGFPKRSESAHDCFDTGHSSTSISAALGLLAGARLTGNGGKVVAVIGDGALTGGMAYEGLSHAGQLGLPLIIVLNDNKMSIGPNVGALSEYLSRLSMKARYQSFRRSVDRLVRKIPFVGDAFYDAIVRMKRGVKAVFYSDNFFVDLGFEYVGPIDGHNLPLLEQVLRDARSLDRPVVVHVITRKGKGYEYAEDDPSSFHGVGSFSVQDGLVEKSGPATFTEAFSLAMREVAAVDDRVCAVTAAMEKGTGLSDFRRTFPHRFFDVGIAEQHAATFAAGLAAAGLRPVVAFYSTFSQRALDQILHDAAIQNLPVTFALDRSGFVGDDGETHQGLFDMALFRTIPNVSIVTPASGAELSRMLRFAIERGQPTIIRYPKTSCPHEIAAFSEPLREGRGVMVRQTGGEILLAFSGGLYPQAAEAADMLLGRGVSVDLYNIRFVKPLDEAFLVALIRRYRAVLIVEEGIESGGFGEAIAALCAREDISVRLKVVGAPDRFPSQATRDELLSDAGLDATGIARAAEALRVRDREEGLRLLRPTSP